MSTPLYLIVIKLLPESIAVITYYFLEATISAPVPELSCINTSISALVAVKSAGKVYPDTVITIL